MSTPYVKTIFASNDLNEIKGIEWSNTNIFFKIYGIEQNDISVILINVCFSNDGVYQTFPVTYVNSESDGGILYESIVSQNSILGVDLINDTTFYASFTDRKGVLYKEYEINKISKGVGGVLYNGESQFCNIQVFRTQNNHGCKLNILYARDTTKTNSYMHQHHADIYVLLSINDINWSSYALKYQKYIPLSVCGKKKTPNPNIYNVELRKLSLEFEEPLTTDYISYCYGIKDQFMNDLLFMNNNFQNYKRNINYIPDIGSFLLEKDFTHSNILNNIASLFYYSDRKEK